MDAARASLLGLSVGDGLGAALDRAGPELQGWTAARSVPGTRLWRWTDDTAMALSVVEMLERRGTIAVDELAQLFVQRFSREPNRGYGAAAYALLMRVSMGFPWRDEAAQLFGGKGSFGNGETAHATTKPYALLPSRRAQDED